MNILVSALTIGLIVGALLFSISLLPTVGPLPSYLQDSIVNMITYIRNYGFFIDFATVFTIVKLILLIEISIVGLRFMLWIIRMWRGAGSGTSA